MMSDRDWIQRTIEHEETGVSGSPGGDYTDCFRTALSRSRSCQ
jgi:hypothetical protein